MKKILLTILLGLSIGCSNKDNLSFQGTKTKLNLLTDRYYVSQKIVKYNLTWEDFKGATPKELYRKSPAGIKWDVVFEKSKNGTVTPYCIPISIGSFRQEFPLGEDGQPMIGGNWPYQSEGLTKDEFWAYILKHEQGHLDLCTSMARKMTQDIFMENLPLDQGKQNWIANQIIIFQEMYDKDTNHGINVNKQIEWNGRFGN